MPEWFCRDTPPESDMHILIMGTPVASGNRGVLALGASIVNLCLNAAPNAEVGYLQVHKPMDDIRIKSNSGVRLVQLTSCRMSLRSALRDHLVWILFMAVLYRLLPSEKIRAAIRKKTPWIEKVHAADLVGDVRGGDSFSDIYGLKRFVLASLPVLSVILIKGSIVHLPQTYGPFKSRTSRAIARFLLRRSSLVIARDLESQRIAQALIGSRLEVQLSPDVAFSLFTEAPQTCLIEPPLNGLPSAETVGLNVNGLMFNGGYHGGNMFGLKLDYRAFLPELITRLLAKPSVNVLLIPHTYAEPGDPESDNDACRQVREMLPAALQERVRIVVGEYDAHEIKGIIGQCGFFIGSRMHSCIAALSQGVPCVGVAYSMKFAGVFESVGMMDWVVDGRTSDAEQSIASILDLFETRDSVRDGLAERSGQARQRLREIFDSIIPDHGKGEPIQVSEVTGLVAESG